MTDAVAYHNDISVDWEARYERGAFRRRLDFFQRCVLPKLEPRGRWLDAGCGTGLFSRVMAEAGCDVVGVDAADGMVADAERRRDGASVASRLAFKKVETIEELPFEDGAFDGCISLSVLEYIPDADTALMEIARVLRPGAQCVLSAPNPASAIRLAQKARRAVSNGRGHESYIEHSKFELRSADAHAWFGQAGFSCDARLSFDPYIPRILHPILPPSLIYYVVRKSDA